MYGPRARHWAYYDIVTASGTAGHDSGAEERFALELIPGMGPFFELQTTGYQFERVAGPIADWLAEALGTR